MFELAQSGKDVASGVAGGLILWVIVIGVIVFVGGLFRSLRKSNKKEDANQ